MCGGVQEELQAQSPLLILGELKFTLALPDKDVSAAKKETAKGAIYEKIKELSMTTTPEHNIAATLCSFVACLTAQRRDRITVHCARILNGWKMTNLWWNSKKRTTKVVRFSLFFVFSMAIDRVVFDIPELKELDAKIEEQREKAGDVEVRDAMMARADFLARIGDKV